MEENLLDKIRKLLRASNVNPREIFGKVDNTKMGKLTNMEFKNALKKFNLSLSVFETD